MSNVHITVPFIELWSVDFFVRMLVVSKRLITVVSMNYCMPLSVCHLKIKSVKDPDGSGRAEYSSFIFSTEESQWHVIILDDSIQRCENNWNSPTPQTTPHTLLRIDRLILFRISQLLPITTKSLNKNWTHDRTTEKQAIRRTWLAPQFRNLWAQARVWPDVWVCSNLKWNSIGAADEIALKPLLTENTD